MDLGSLTRIENVDVDCDIDQVIAYSTQDPSHDLVDTVCVDVCRHDRLESALRVVPKVFCSVEKDCSVSNVDARIILQNTLLVGEVKQSTVSDFVVLVDAAAPLLRIPGVKVRVEVDDSDFTPDFV